MIKIVFLDIDGTLIEPGKSSVSDGVKRLIVDIQHKGIVPVLVSGRPAFSTSSLAESLSINTFVAYNGGIIVVKGEQIYNQPLGKALLKDFVLFAESMAHPLIFPGDEGYYMTHEHHPMVELILENHGWMRAFFDPGYWCDHDMYQLELIAPPESLNTYKMAFGRRLHLYPWHGFENAVNVNPVENSKAMAVRRILEHLSLDVSATVAIGDGPNDVEMIQLAHIGIAMGNACDEVKSVANFVTYDVSHDGVVKALQQVLTMDSRD